MPTTVEVGTNLIELERPPLYVSSGYGLHVPDQTTASNVRSIWYISSSTTATSTTFCQTQSTWSTTSAVSSTSTGFTIIRRVGQEWITEPLQVWGNTRVPAVLHKARPPEKTVRNSIKRALKLISNFGFEEDARIFLRGDSIEISHPDSDFKFVLTKNSSIVQRTQYPGYASSFKTQLYTKSDVFVANLCVYMEGTPVLDQMLALAMFIKTGDEEMILRKANFLGLTSDEELKQRLAICNPYLQQKLLRH